MSAQPNPDRLEWYSGPGNNYSHACGCGRTTTVSTPQAGSDVKCECGRELKVPSLSRLRMLTGRDGYESGVIDEIRRLIRDRGLPSMSICALSKRPTEDTVTVSITVPRFFKNPEKDDWKLVLVAGWVGVFFVNAFRKPVFEEEGSMTIEMQLRVASNQQAKTREMSQSRLRKLLRIEPLYARLLEENPHCRITILE
ncbi:hypothetical protein V5E97_12720 [Singulisphaera sp. Ch08]|uniref:Uncharacterized protein n=1 Tax=Singulisphaera sp. Ch08 TaxID=3120278 RepID=A0AAU7CNJ6_9BACT